MSFVVLPQNSVTTLATLFFSVMQVVASSETVPFSIVNQTVQTMVKMWLAVVNKESLLSEPLVHNLLIEMLDVDDENSVVLLNGFVGNCILQSLNPSSLNMQRLMACMFHSCRSSIRLLWDGEMP